MWHAHVSWVSGTNLGSHELPQHHHHPIHQNNVSKFHYTSITILHIKLPDTQVSQYYISSQLPIMLPVNQLCSWLPIMLLAINYAQNYASIIGKGLIHSHKTTPNHSGASPQHLGLEVGLTYGSITKDSNTKTKNLIMDIIEERKGYKMT